MPVNSRPAKSAKPIVLTKRDSEIFGTISSYRAMNAEQIGALFFTSLARGRRRLRALWHAGFLKRSQRAVRYGEGTSKYFYSVTLKAIRHLKDTTSDNASLSVPRRSDVSLHAEKINDFRVCLELAGRSHNPELALWQEGRELKMKTYASVRSTRKPLSIIPDALFTLRLNAREYSYFLEIDRGTTDLHRLAMKLEGYSNLFGHKVPQKTFGIRSFRVLLVTTSRSRIENLAKRMISLEHRISRQDLYCFADLTICSLRNPEKIFEPVWQVMNPGGRLKLSRPLPTLPPSTFPLMPGKPPVH